MLNKSHTKSVSVRDLLTQDEIDTCTSVAQAIRLCKATVPDATNGEISRFLTKMNEGVLVRPQWVHNVLNYEPKRKG